MKTFATRLAIGAALTASLLGATATTAHAATPHQATLRITSRPHPPRSSDGEICSDWTNEDGTHGSNFPTWGGAGTWGIGGDWNPPQEGVGDG